MARIQTMIVPSAGEAVEFVVIIDDIAPRECQSIKEQEELKELFGARGVLCYPGLIDVV